MKTLKQLLRQPGKTLLGILLVALALAALTVCLGQYLAAGETAQELTYLYNTVALPAQDFDLPALEKLIADHPELIKLDSRPGLASAYAPELEPDLYVLHADTRYAYRANDRTGSRLPLPEGAPYTCALLEVTILEVGPAVIRPKMPLPWDEAHQEDPASTMLSCRVEKVHALPSGYNDPTGFTLDVYLYGATAQQAQARGLTAGQRCLVYGTNYFDWDYVAREAYRAVQGENYVASHPIEKTDPQRFTWFTEAEMGSQQDIVGTYDHEGHTVQIRRHNAWQFLRAQLEDPVILPLDTDGGSVLAADAQWAAYREQADINSHAFPVVGVDKLGYIGNFARERARIQEGRDFTQEELDSGAKKCILSKSLAEANGLQVGDTVKLHYYGLDPALPQSQRIGSGLGATEPAAYFFTGSTPFVGEPESYTIVGLYQGPEWEEPWEDRFAFTPNTIFVPKQAVTAPMDYSDKAFFRTLVLENDATAEVVRLLGEQGFDELFLFYDHGYLKVKESFEAFSQAARNAAVIGGASYGLILCLFFMLFPCQQGKTLKTMQNLGASRGSRMRHVLVSTLGLLVPGTLLGAGAGIALWDTVSRRLGAAAGTDMTFALDLGSVGRILLGQALPVACVTVLISYLVSRRKKL